MKVTFTIKKGIETEKDGIFKTKNVNMYNLTASFIPSELEKKIFNEHPLFKNIIFMEYNELDKWTTGLIFKDKHQKDRIKRILVKAIFKSSDYIFRAYSIKRILELRILVIKAGIQFANIIEILEKLEGTDEFNFIPSELDKIELEELKKE
jgi:hypothetical protein